MSPQYDALLFTIPIQIREDLQIDPGHTEITYELTGTPTEQSSNCWVIPNPEKPLFGRKPVTYKVSTKGQIRIPGEVLHHLGIQQKDELDIEISGGRIRLVRNRLYQFRDLLHELRPSFFTTQDPNDNVLTVMFHEYPDEGGKILRVNRATFSKLESLYNRLKAKYEPNNPNPWVGVPLEPEGTFEEGGLSLTLDKGTNPATLTIQKLGPAFMPDPVKSLWSKREAFTIIDDTIFYYENRERVSKKIDFLPREVGALFNRNARTFGEYRTAAGSPIGTVELYNGDLVVFEYKGTFTLHYWPKIIPRK